MSAVLPPHRPLPMSGRHTMRSFWAALATGSLAASCVHLCFSTIFFTLESAVLAWANVGSAVLYLVVHQLLKHRCYRLVVALLAIQIPTHAVTATLGVGWESGFHYYLLLLIPMLFVSPAGAIAVKLLLSGLVTALYIALDVYAHQHAVWTAVSPETLQWLRGLNLVCTVVLMAFLSHGYLIAVLSTERRLRELAATDALTGLANRRRALQVANMQFGRRRVDGSSVCFIRGDVDNFKSINDRHGHDTGDRVLAGVAEALRTATRERDTVSRWGGEEFLAVLPDTGLGDAMIVAERVREMVRNLKIEHHGVLLPVTITLGVSCLRDAETLDQAIARADAAMYRGKVEGRNRHIAEAPTPPVPPPPPPPNLRRRHADTVPAALPQADRVQG